MNKKGFTLVELLAVITILAIILVIAVPKISSYIVNKKKNLFLTSAKNIVRQLSYENIELETITDGKLSEAGLSGISLSDYDLDKSVVYVVDDDVYINLKGKGQFEGMYLCKVGISTEDTVSEVECDESYLTIKLTVDLDGGETTQTFEEEYGKRSELTLDIPTKEGYIFTGWEVVEGNSIISGNKIIFGTRDTKIKAKFSISYTCTVGTYLKKGETSCSTCPTGKTCLGGTFPYSETIDQGIQECTYAGDLVQGAEYVNGQYTYRYMQHRWNEPGEGVTPITWQDMNYDGWGVVLTDKDSTQK